MAREKETKKNRWNVGEVLQWTASHFASKGIASPRLDADILLAHALRVDRMFLYLNIDRPLLQSERDRFRELVARRARREPVALIVGTKEFWSLPLRVRPGVLIPRPETETLVEAVVEVIGEMHAPRILEIGTGTGAISIAIARECPSARITATDIDRDALDLARSNAAELADGSDMEFLESDVFSRVPNGEPFHVICSNPPYVPTEVIPTLEPEIVDFEPVRALDGGPSGLDLIRRLVAQAGNFLTDDGALILEFGDGQESAVEEILRSEGGFPDISFRMDLSGKARVVVAKK